MVQQWSMPKPATGRKSRFLPQLKGPHRNIAITFNMENLEWCGTLMVKKIWEYVLTKYTNMTDGHRMIDGIVRTSA